MGQLWQDVALIMNDFLEFVDELTERFKIHVEIYHSSIMDWCIIVYRKGCGENNTDLKMCQVQDCDMKLAFARAQVELKEWLSENEGGY